MGAHDSWIAGLTPNPTEGLLGQFRTAAERACPGSVANHVVDETAYDCYEFSECPSAYEMCIYHDLGHNIDSSMTILALNHLLGDAPSSESTPAPSDGINCNDISCPRHRFIFPVFIEGDLFIWGRVSLSFQFF